MEQIELHTGYFWDCQNCGTENFTRAVINEITDEDADYYIEKYGYDREYWQTGHFVSIPDTVICKSCETEYEAKDRGDL